jgi:hypothetical protein
MLLQAMVKMLSAFLRCTSPHFFGPSRHFAAAQQFSRFWSEADIQRAARTEPDL